VIDITVDEDARALAAHWLNVAGEVERVVLPIMRKGANDIQAAGQARAPVDTGFLKNSITSQVRSAGGSVGIGFAIEVGPTAEYGGFVENGTSTMGPQPYMGPAFDVVVPGIVSALGEGMDGLV